MVVSTILIKKYIRLYRYSIMLRNNEDGQKLILLVSKLSQESNSWKLRKFEAKNSYLDPRTQRVR